MTTDFNLLRSHLESERKHLIEKLERLNASVRQAGEQREGNPFGKWDESGMESSEVDKCLALQKRIIGTLTEVERALHKLEAGTYVFCDNCGQPIDPARLEALPQASLCLTCKARKGNKQRVTDNECETHQKMGVVHDIRRANSQPGWEDWFENFGE